MGWSIGYDTTWCRDVGYGVPAICDQPGCDKKIDRGLGYVCGGDPYGGEHGCGLYFCERHLIMANKRDCELCKRCKQHGAPYEPKPDVDEWVSWKLTDESWAQWRTENPIEVHALTMRFVDIGDVVVM